MDRVPARERGVTGERLETHWCPRCTCQVLWYCRGSVGQCQVCGHATSGGRIVVLGNPDTEEQQRDHFRDFPIDEVAP